MAHSTDISLKTLSTNIHSALRHYHSIDKNAPNNLLADLELVRAQRRQMGINNTAGLRFATNKVLLDGIKELKHRNDLAGSLLNFRFIDKLTIKEVNQKFKFNNYEKVKRYQKDALDLLTTIINEQEIKFRESRITEMESSLEAKSYSQLFGINELAANLFEDLQNSDKNGVISLIGIGGIGKTSLANFVARKIIRRFTYESIIWLSIPDRFNKTSLNNSEQIYHQLLLQMCTKLLPALSSAVKYEQKQESLRQILKETPYLIIIDNLEKQSDTTYLLSNLLELSQPSKFLLTSRYKHSAHANIQSYTINELSQDDSIALIRDFATEVSLPEIANAPQDRLMPLYETVGGNPFALKLIISLANVRSVSEIIFDLQQVRSKDIEDLYTKIFTHSWNSLSHSAKKILAIMPLSANSGMLPEQILSVSQLTKEELWPAINELVGLSLLEVKGSAWKRRYGIHRLTDTFIHNEVLKS